MNASRSPVAIRDGVLVSHLPGESILLHMGTKKYYRLNETGAEIWKGLEEGETREEIVDRLVARYAVSEVEAEAAVDEQLAELAASELIDRRGAAGGGAGDPVGEDAP